MLRYDKAFKLEAVGAAMTVCTNACLPLLLRRVALDLQVFILNGASYDQRFLDATRSSSLARADSSNPDRWAGAWVGKQAGRQTGRC